MSRSATRPNAPCAMRSTSDLCQGCGGSRPAMLRRSIELPTRRLDANLVPPVHDDPRKRGLRIRLQRGRQIDGLDALQMDALNCTVDFPSAAQSAASLIAVSKAFASKAGMLWIRPSP